MHRRPSLALSIASGLLSLSLFGCSETGSGGSTTSSSSAAGSTSSSSQSTVGGATASGGQTSAGGIASTSSKVGGTTVESVATTDSGGKTASGGQTSAVGGTTSSKPGGNASNGGSVVDAGTPGAGGGRDAGSAGGRTATGGSTSTTASTGSTGSVGTGINHKKFFGNIDTAGRIRDDFKSMWDQFTPENAGKWGSVQGGGQSSFNWGSLDTMYKYCTDNNILFKQHCFIWGAQQPSWVTSSNAETAVKAWMKAFCDRYPKVAIIDVVNEPLHPPVSYKDGIGGSGTSGWDWIVNALKWAREACPNAVLVVNDYNTIEYSSENGRIISLANAVKKAGGPIDALGAQAHDVAKVSAATLKSYSEKIIADTGLPMYITELDIGVADDTQQATMMRDFVTPAWANPKIPGITHWGYIVGNTWRANTGLMTSSGTKRASLTWLMTFLNR